VRGVRAASKTKKDSHRAIDHLRNANRVAVRKFGLGEFDRTVIKKILNHTDGSVTAIYDRYDYDREKRAALTRWDRQVRAIVSGKPTPAKVVSFHA
jgi:hypothetical protein